MPFKDTPPDRNTIIVFMVGLGVSLIAFIARAYQVGSKERPKTVAEFLAGAFGAMLFGYVANAFAINMFSITTTSSWAISGVFSWLGGDVFTKTALGVIGKYVKANDSTSPPRKEGDS